MLLLLPSGGRLFDTLQLNPSIIKVHVTVRVFPHSCTTDMDKLQVSVVHVCIVCCLLMYLFYVDRIQLYVFYRLHYNMVVNFNTVVQ